MKISKRLKAAAEIIPKCNIIADICSDHAFLPIYCVEKGICQQAIAGDIAMGPCEQGQRQIDIHGLIDKIEVRCGAGLSVLKNNEVDGIVIAGVGGATIVEILRDEIDKVKEADFLVLQPQNGFKQLRQYLSESMFRIEDEILVEENNIFYQIMLIKNGSMIIKDELELTYGPINIMNKDKKLLKYLRSELKHLSNVNNQLNKADPDKVRKTQLEVQGQISRIEDYIKKI